MDTPYLYLYINLFTILVPLIRSFESRVAYYRSFKALFTAIAMVGGFFIIWDAIFTHYAIWGFNERYLSGIYLLKLPLGEWLFFVTVPYSCVFIYRVLNYFIRKNILARQQTSISNFLMGFSVTIAIVYYDRWYTFLTFSFLAILIYLHTKVWQTPWMGRFYLAYAVILIPFLIVNGLLTGSGIEEQVVWYNDDENVGIRLFTIPVEDAFYGMLLILGVVSLYEYYGKKWGLTFAQETTTE